MDIFLRLTDIKIRKSKNNSKTEDVKLAKYKKCPRCELNYILEDEDYCEICKQELKGIFCNVDVDEDDDAELCPVCGINFLNEGEKMCEACAAARADEEKGSAIDDVEPDSWDTEDDSVTDDETLQTKKKRATKKKNRTTKKPTSTTISRISPTTSTTMKTMKGTTKTTTSEIKKDNLIERKPR